MVRLADGELDVEESHWGLELVNRKGTGESLVNQLKAIPFREMGNIRHKMTS